MKLRPHGVQYVSGFMQMQMLGEKVDEKNTFEPRTRAKHDAGQAAKRARE